MLEHAKARRADTGARATARRARVEYTVIDGHIEGTVMLPGRSPQRFSGTGELEACLNVDPHRLRLVETEHAGEAGDSLAALSETELAIARRAAAGDSNRQIGDALFYSVKSVEAYLTRIYRRLGLDGRESLAELMIDLEPLDAHADAVAGGAGAAPGTGTGRARGVVADLLLV